MNRCEVYIHNEITALSITHSITLSNYAAKISHHPFLNEVVAKDAFLSSKGSLFLGDDGSGTDMHECPDSVHNHPVDDGYMQGFKVSGTTALFGSTAVGDLECNSGIYVCMLLCVYVCKIMYVYVCTYV